MKLTLDSIENWDLTWFAYDNNGHIAVFFSNGTRLVLIDNILKEDNYIEAIDYFDSLPNINQYHDNNQSNIHQKSNIIYSDDINSYTRKGLFVYDIVNPNNQIYSLVASPEVPIFIDNIDTIIKYKIEEFNGVFTEEISIEPVL